VDVDPSARLAGEYSAKAEAYERYWAPVIGPMALPLVSALPLATARLVLDIGAGTGSHLAALAGAAPRARVIAVDRAEGMIRIATRRTGHPAAVMDAQALALRPRVIDVATLVFMLFHVPSPSTALGEVRRVLRPGGTAGVVTWGKDSGTPGASIWTEELDSHGAAPDPRDPSVMQQAQMDTPAKLERLLSSSGYTHVHIWSRTFEYLWTVDALMALQLTCGMAARRVVSLPAAGRSACESTVRERLGSLREADLAQRSEALFAVVVTPART
jgi:SAM-dependent methyltransferase